MRKGKIILGTIALMYSVICVFAFKTSKFTETQNIYTNSGSIYTLVLSSCQYPKLAPFEIICITIPSAAGYYYLYNGIYRPLPAGTPTYTTIK